MTREKTAFEDALHAKCQQSLRNNFGRENFDEDRHGKYQEGESAFVGNLRALAKKVLNYYPFHQEAEYERILGEYGPRLAKIYSHLDEPDRSLLIDILAFRILGYRHVKLPTNNAFYWESLQRVEKLKDPKDTIDPHFMHFILHRFDLAGIGYDIRLYFIGFGVVMDFLLEQYAYKSNSRTVVSAEPGDVVLDLGGCWGDTALYFASKVGDRGKVYSFEFIPGNIEIFRRNIGLNSKLADRIQLVPNPVGEASDARIYFKDLGPGSKVKFEPFPDQTGEAETVSVDDFVTRNGLEKVSFLKMDIEGAEPIALKGAINTIRKFRPKLAIAIYHSLDDFSNIPNWILDLDLGYKIHLGHYTIYKGETVVFATVDDPAALVK